MYGLPGSGKSFLCHCFINQTSTLFPAETLYLNFPSNPTAAQLVESYKPLLTFFGVDDLKDVHSISQVSLNLLDKPYLLQALHKGKCPYYFLSLSFFWHA